VNPAGLAPFLSFTGSGKTRRFKKRTKRNRGVKRNATCQQSRLRYAGAFTFSSRRNVEEDLVELFGEQLARINEEWLSNFGAVVKGEEDTH